MSKRVFEEITSYHFYNNDPAWKRRKIETDYTLWKSKMDKYNKNDLLLLQNFKNVGFDFYKINDSEYNINSIVNRCSHLNTQTNQIELKPIMYILIVKLYDNSYKLKIGCTNILKDSKTKGLRLDRLVTHSQNFDEIYYYMMIPIEGRHIEERFHSYMKDHYPNLIVQNPRNNKKQLVKEIYELDPKIIDILFVNTK